ncbi:hypothetical protein [Nitrosopumilus sp.]|uniref:hypothetical protein n=1 Tax=Nitrosopumilus sp. TaxID=2024843 RepID=UPI00292DF367|nr:hypothetical protein [Nitrosopumilus sp.]
MVTFDEPVIIRDDNGRAFKLDLSGFLNMGGSSGKLSGIRIMDSSGRFIMEFMPNFKTDQGTPKGGFLKLGHKGASNIDFKIINKEGKEVFKFDADDGSLTIVPKLSTRRKTLFDIHPLKVRGSSLMSKNGFTFNVGPDFSYNGANRTLTISKDTKSIDLNPKEFIINHADKERVRLTSGGNLFLGGNGDDGDLVCKNASGKDTIRCDGKSGDIELNKTIHLDGKSGDIELNKNNKKVIRLDTQNEEIIINHADKERVRLTSGGNLFLGGNGDDGDLVCKNASGKDTIRCDGKSGDIELLNADCAEEFSISSSSSVDPGSVMTISSEDELVPCEKAYDQKVAGVISGAGNYKPGIVLDKQKSNKQRLPLALMGKVYCKADASYESIKVGDLLTTSETFGHAMKANDSARSIGSIIGKSLRALPDGKGLIPILVALQ